MAEYANKTLRNITSTLVNGVLFFLILPFGIEASSQPWASKMPMADAVPTSELADDCSCGHDCV